MTTSLTMQKIHQFLPESKFVNALPGRLHEPIGNFSTDSRQIQANDFFIAICGEKFDGNQFLPEVFKKGAMGAIASELNCIPPNQPVIMVNDTLKALQEVAHQWRVEVDPQVVLVTGSNGKTTVKEMIALIFRQFNGESKTLATQGNFNNEIGLPLTLLGLQGQHHTAVIELGMNHPGETKSLSAIACPNITLINNAQREHQEFMHTVEAVANEHGDAILALPPDGVAIFPHDSEFTELWKKLSGSRQYYDFALTDAGKKSSAKVTGQWLPNGHLQIHLPKKADGLSSKSIEVRLTTLGDHNAKNAIAAAAVAWAANVSSDVIMTALQDFVPIAGRMRSHPLPHFSDESCVIDDTYNANPDSVIAAINVLSKMPGLRWLILGDMGEVGDKGELFHQEIGVYAQQMGVHHLYTTGSLSKYAIDAFTEKMVSKKVVEEQLAMHFSEPKLLVKRLKNDLAILQASSASSIASILVKGSRFTKMERVVKCLLNEASICF